MESLSEYSDSVKNSAERLILDINLESILNGFGKIVYTGSYAANIMINRDIDLYLVKTDDFDIEDVMRIHNDFFQSKLIRGNILLGNNFHQTHPEYIFPKGYYLGLKTWNVTKEHEREKWKIDIWMISEDELRKMKYLDLSEIITEDSRELLLEIKHYVVSNRLDIPSIEIYNAVFEYKYNTLESFIRNVVH